MKKLSAVGPNRDQNGSAFSPAGSVFKFSPQGSGYRDGEAFFATVSGPAESLARFDPPGDQRGDPCRSQLPAGSLLIGVAAPIIFRLADPDRAAVRRCSR